jgi:hypothetical protein
MGHLNLERQLRPQLELERPLRLQLGMLMAKVMMFRRNQLKGKRGQKGKPKTARKKREMPRKQRLRLSRQVGEFEIRWKDHLGKLGFSLFLVERLKDCILELNAELCLCSLEKCSDIIR